MSNEKYTVSEEEAPLEEIRIPIKWNIPESIDSKFATNLVVQHLDHEFIISFFEAYPPIILGTPEEKAAETRQLKSIEAKCVARVVVPADRIKGFIGVLIENYEKYLSKQREEWKEEE